MYCTHCGRETASDARFCPACGKSTPIWQAEHAGLPPKRLYRLAGDKKIAGICSGLAKYLNIDVTVVRILTVAVAAITGFLPGVIAYLIVWAIMPLESLIETPRPEPHHTESVSQPV
ncbi:MAG: PspC domain-containing protein [Bryobacterales bacterium]|nr:PspC domain-containing protein [Bryobacterales bacterium]